MRNPSIPSQRGRKKNTERETSYKLHFISRWCFRRKNDGKSGRALQTSRVPWVAQLRQKQPNEKARVHRNAFSRNASSFSREQNGLFVLPAAYLVLLSRVPLWIFAALRVIRHPSFRPLLDHHTNTLRVVSYIVHRIFIDTFFFSPILVCKMQLEGNHKHTTNASIPRAFQKKKKLFLGLTAGAGPLMIGATHQRPLRHGRSADAIAPNPVVTCKHTQKNRTWVISHLSRGGKSRRRNVKTANFSKQQCTHTKSM